MAWENLNDDEQKLALNLQRLAGSLDSLGCSLCSRGGRRLGSSANRSGMIDKLNHSDNFTLEAAEMVDRAINHVSDMINRNQSESKLGDS